jgi:hypothetical protein
MIICILLLVAVSPVFNPASAGRQPVKSSAGTHTKEAQAAMDSKQGTRLPVFPAHPEEAPHGKPAKAPHMEEIPHIHRYHRERVKKVKYHHSKLWLLSQALVVICNLSLLWIAYMHLTH